jgi:hypothetical protein
MPIAYNLPWAFSRSQLWPALGLHVELVNWPDPCPSFCDAGTFVLADSRMYYFMDSLTLVSEIEPVGHNLVSFMVTLTSKGQSKSTTDTTKA